ncbi:MAG: peptidoglycan-binding domain-containing protein [bacterium]
MKKILPILAFVILTGISISFGAKSAFALSCTALYSDLKLNSTNSSSGGEVTLLQNYLLEKGYLNTKPTGRFGEATQSAVIKLQKANNLPATGLVGSMTRALIKKSSCQNTNTSSIMTSNISQITTAVSQPAVSLPTLNVSINKSIPETVTSPREGDNLTTDTSYNISWIKKSGIVYDILLEDSTGLGMGYIMSGQYQTDSYSWKVGQIFISSGWVGKMMPPGKYRIHLRESSMNKPELDQVSGLFNIVEKPLYIRNILPTSAVADGNTTVVIYGSGFNELTAVRFDGSADNNGRIITPSYISPDKKILLFSPQSNIYAGSHTVDLINIYNEASSTPSNNVTMDITK